MKQKNLLFTISLCFLFFISRLMSLTKLPIFADEAIYLRWSTMIFHDPQQFLFLPLYDGKTPLFVWMLIPITRLFTINPLLGGRILVMLFGLITAFVLTRIVRLLGGTRRAEMIAFLLYVFMPFTFFFDRLSLMDVPLTFFLSLAYLFALSWYFSSTWKHALLGGFFWGLAVLTKTSAIYTIPVFMLVPLYGLYRHKNDGRRWIKVAQFLTAGSIGLLMLLVLKITPLFPFLFNRSSDFAFSVSQILTNPFGIIGMNVPRISSWLWWYISPPLWIMTIGSLKYMFQKRKQFRVIGGLMLSGFLFVSLFAISGKLLTSRYFLPSIIWFVPAFGLLLDYWYRKLRMIGLSFGALIILFSLWFIAPLYTNLNAAKLTPDDRRQYLSEWSAGFGIPETRRYLIGRVEAGKRVLVATEGHFGTLPDGLFIYFSETSWLDNMEIIGVGQPLHQMPEELLTKSPQFDEAYLVVNQNRIIYDYSHEFELVGTFKKPYDGHPLLLLRLKK